MMQEVGIQWARKKVGDYGGKGCLLHGSPRSWREEESCNPIIPSRENRSDLTSSKKAPPFTVEFLRARREERSERIPDINSASEGTSKEQQLEKRSKPRSPEPNGHGKENTEGHCSELQCAEKYRNLWNFPLSGSCFLNPSDAL